MIFNTILEHIHSLKKKPHTLLPSLPSVPIPQGGSHESTLFFEKNSNILFWDWVSFQHKYNKTVLMLIDDFYIFSELQIFLATRLGLFSFCFLFWVALGLKLRPLNL
jgi:hypothetical protein